ELRVVEIDADDRVRPALRGDDLQRIHRALLRLLELPLERRRPGAEEVRDVTAYFREDAGPDDELDALDAQILRDVVAVDRRRGRDDDVLHGLRDLFAAVPPVLLYRGAALLFLRLHRGAVLPFRLLHRQLASRAIVDATAEVGGQGT